MNIVNWFRSRFSSRGKALSLYRRGMARTRKHDHQGAVDSYSAAIELPDAPSDVKAMALYNRALAYVAAGDKPKGINDLDAVVAMDESLINIRSMAKQKLAKMESRSRRRNA